MQYVETGSLADEHFHPNGCHLDLSLVGRDGIYQYRRHRERWGGGTMEVSSLTQTEMRSFGMSFCVIDALVFPN